MPKPWRPSKHNIRDEWLARHVGQEKPKSMAALTALMTRFCAGEDSWLAPSKNTANEAGPSEVKNSNGKLRRSRHKHRSNDDKADDTAVNAGFSGSKSGQQKKSYKRNNQGPSSIDRILDRPCQIHGTPGKPANHTNRDCWVFKQAGKLNAENKEKDCRARTMTRSPCSQTHGDRRSFPLRSKR